MLILGGSTAGLAADNTTNRISLYGGFGGSVDQNDAGYGNIGFQLGYSVAMGNRTDVELRVGELDFGSEDSIDLLSAPSITYATIVSQYRFPEKFYESGLYLGLGAYRIEGLDVFNESFQDTNMGIAFGATGHFDLARSWVVLVELSGHYMNASYFEFLAMVHAGVGYRF